MKIDINRIPAEGLSLTEKVNPSDLDLDTELLKFCGPLEIKADIFKITNAVTVQAKLSGSLSANCSRCLNEFKIDLKKDLRLNYQVNNSEPVIDLDQDLKEEIILDYPLKPLCKADCKGLCPKCGKDLNEGGCSCGITENKTL